MCKTGLGVRWMEKCVAQLTSLAFSHYITRPLSMFILRVADTLGVSLLKLLCSERFVSLFEGFLPGIATWLTNATTQFSGWLSGGREKFE